MSARRRVRLTPITYRVVRADWVVMRFHQDRLTGTSNLPLVSFPATPASNVWQCQSAMVELQRRGIRCYMELSETYEAAR